MTNPEPKDRRTGKAPNHQAAAMKSKLVTTERSPLNPLDGIGATIIIKQTAEKIILFDGDDRITTTNKERAVEIFRNWLNGERLPKPKFNL